MFRPADELISATQGMLAFPDELTQRREMHIDPAIELVGWVACKIDIDNRVDRYQYGSRMMARFDGPPTAEVQVVFVGVQRGARASGEAMLYKIESIFVGQMDRDQVNKPLKGYWRETRMSLEDGRVLDWDPMPPIKPVMQTAMKVKKSKPEAIDERDVQQLEAAIDAIEKSQ
jgi:hypothetical protein